MFDSSATRPYTVSAMACWARAQQLGYISLDKAGKVRMCSLLCPVGPAVLSGSNVSEIHPLDQSGCRGVCEAHVEAQELGGS